MTLKSQIYTWICSSRPRPRPRYKSKHRRTPIGRTRLLESALSKVVSWTSTMGSHTWSATKPCEDHLNTAGATGSNRTQFAALFLRGRISFQWHQHKRRVEDVAPLSWVHFKTFLQKNLGDSRAFVDTIWSRVKRGSQYQREEVQD